MREDEISDVTSFDLPDERLLAGQTDPGEVFDLMQHDADRYLAGLLAEQERLHRESKRRSLSAVPF